MGRWIVHAGVVVSLCLAVCQPASGEEFEESQLFLDLEAHGDLSDRLSYFVNHQSKMRDDDDAYFLWHLKGGIRYEAATWLQLALDHRYQDDRAKGDWLQESRSTLEATPHIKLGGWNLSSRNRMEYRDFEGSKPDRWRYRNQLKVAHALPFWGLSAYVSEEPQYDFEKSRWYKHRATAGLSRKMTDWLKLSLYYRWDIIEQSKDHGHWDTNQIVGIKMVVDLDGLAGK